MTQPASACKLVCSTSLSSPAAGATDCGCYADGSIKPAAALAEAEQCQRDVYQAQLILLLVLFKYAMLPSGLALPT
jgi:hypothetical protein